MISFSVIYYFKVNPFNLRFFVFFAHKGAFNLIMPRFIPYGIHKLIHASNTETIHKYMDLLQLDSKRLAKVNNLRQLASMQPI